MRNRWLWVGVYVVATALLAGGVIFLIHDREAATEAATGALDDLAPMPFASGLTPVGATTGRVGDTLTFQASGYPADDVRSVELWDGGTRIETDPAPGGSTALLTLPALSVGSHAVYAKVTDGRGQTSITAPVPVDIVANGSDVVQPVEVVADEDETVGALAKRLGVDVDRIAVLAAGTAALDPEDVRPLELAPTDVIPVGALVTAQPDGDAGLADAVSPDPVVAAGGGTSSSGGLALAAKADGCAVTLTVSGASGTVDLWDGAGSSAGWRRVGQRKGDGTASIPAVTPGLHLYYASTSKGKTSPVQVTMPTTCNKAVGWTGEASITDGILTVTNGMGTGNQWLYLQVDGGTAVRVPATGSLPPVGLHTDIGSLLPPLEGKSLDLELWQGDEFLDELAASGHLDVPDGGSVSDVVGESRQLDLKLTDPAGPAAVLDTQDRNLTFTWTAGPRIEAVLYQVLVDDLPITQTTAIPEQLLATGVSARSGAGATGSGTFTIDTAAIPGRTATGRNAASSVTAAYPVDTPQVIGTKVTSGSKPATVTPIGPTTAAKAAQAPVLIDLPTFGDSVYVRAIGLSSGGAGAISASNSIRVQLPVPQGIDGKTVDFVSGTDFGDTTFDPGHLPVRYFGPCVWADVSWNGPIDYGPYQQRTPNGPTVRIEAMSKAYPSDGTYCPADFPPPPPPASADCPVAQFFCDVWEGIKEFGGAILTAAEAVYRFATAVMSTVVDKVASAVAKYSGVCDALDGVAKGSKKTCGAVLKMATEAAISAVLVSVGVPPALPDPSILASVAKGDFAAVAVTLMEATGIPCSSFKPDPDVADAMDAAASKTTGASGLVTAVKDPCLAIATALVATVKANVLTKAQTALAQGAGLPYVPIISATESLTLTPSPLGRTGPTGVTLRMQPRDDNADAAGIACSVTVRVVNVATDGGTERTVIPSQVVTVPELPAPNRGRWERTIVLASDAPTKDLLNGTWHLRATTPMAPGGCLLTSIDLEGTPPTLPNYAKDRKKGQPTVAAARPNG